MAKGDIELNGSANGYFLRRDRNGEIDLKIETVNQYATPFHTPGLQRPTESDAVQTLQFPNFFDGLGRDRIDSDSAGEVSEHRRFFDATADTRWASGVYLPILEEDAAQTSNRVVRGKAKHKGDTWVLLETNDDAGNTAVYAHKFNSGTWEAGGNPSAITAPLVGLALTSYKDYLFQVAGSSSSRYIDSRSTNGSSWDAYGTSLGTLLSNDLTVNEDFDGCQLETIGGELAIVLWHESNATITFFSSTDAASLSDEGVDIPSGNGPQGAAVMAGIDNEDKLYVGTREGLWEVDTAPGTWTTRLIFPMTPHTDNCRGMTVHSGDGALWFAQGVDDDTPPIVYRMFVRNGERQIERVPNDFSLGDGLPAEAAGPIRDMESANGMLYACSGGGKAGRNARVWCHNGRGWHSLRRHGTANQQIDWVIASADNDGTPRLHYAVRTGTTAHDLVFLAQAFVNPASGVTIKRETTGYVDMPYVDASHGITQKTWARVGVNGTDLGTTSAEYINVDYGSGDSGALTARGSFTNLGDITSTVSALKFASGAGLAARNLALRINLIRDAGSNTQTPILKDVQIDYTLVLEQLERYTFTIDIARTAREFNRTPATIMAQLVTARDLATYPTFKFGPTIDTFVKIQPPNRWEVARSGSGGSGSAANAASDVLVQPTGFITVVAQEVIA